jgi:hypothetical protein
MARATEHTLQTCRSLLAANRSFTNAILDAARCHQELSLAAMRAALARGIETSTLLPEALRQTRRDLGGYITTQRPDTAA